MKYKIAIWEEISGYIDVEAESKEEAEEEALQLMDECGCMKLLCPEIFGGNYSLKYSGGQLTKYNGDATHRKAEVLTCEEVDEKI